MHELDHWTIAYRPWHPLEGEKDAIGAGRRPSHGDQVSGMAGYVFAVGPRGPRRTRPPALREHAGGARAASPVASQCEAAGRPDDRPQRARLSADLARYYSRFFEPEDIYVLDNETNDGYHGLGGFVRIPVARDRSITLDGRDRCRPPGGAPGRYDVVVTTDVDEIVAPIPEWGSGCVPRPHRRELGQLLRLRDPPHARPRTAVRSRPPGSRAARPLVRQHRLRQARGRRPSTAVGGDPMPRRQAGKNLDPDLDLIHLHRMDFGICRERHLLGRRRGWNDARPRTGLGVSQPGGRRGRLRALVLRGQPGSRSREWKPWSSRSRLHGASCSRGSNRGEAACIVQRPEREWRKARQPPSRRPGAVRLRRAEPVTDEPAARVARSRDRPRRRGRRSGRQARMSSDTPISTC